MDNHPKKLWQQPKKAGFRDPDEFQAFMAEATDGVSVQPLNGGQFQAELSLAMLPRMALFSIEQVNFSALRPAKGDLWSITIPVAGGFSAAVGGRARRHHFGKNEYFLLRPDRDFDFTAPGTSRALVANLLSQDLRQKALALSGGRAAKLSEVIPAATAAGGALKRFAHHFWTELQRPAGLWDCSVALAEMEDCLVSLLALAASESGHDASAAVNLATLRSAEDFLVRHLTRPVTRSELADAVGVSIRTLSRGFQKRHGVGPMGWLRARRLEAAQLELRDAAPGEVTVTNVALRYGFENPGRFAVQYRRRFGECPSETLRGG